MQYASGISEFVERSNRAVPPDFYLLPLAEQRRLYHGLTVEFPYDLPTDVAIHDDTVTHDGSSYRVRVYRPARPRGDGLLVYLRGGGFVVGSLETHNSAVAELAARSGLVTVAPDFRMAPEHPFPAALEDCYGALCGLAADARRLGVAADRIVICGDSSGANMAVVLAMMSRDRGGPPLRGQALISPVLDFTRWRGGGADVPLLTGGEMAYYTACYCPVPERAAEPYVSPLVSGTFDGLPPAYIMGAELDSLLVDSEEYAARLRAAGTPVQLVVEPGLVHAAVRARGLSPAVADAWHRFCTEAAALAGVDRAAVAADRPAVVVDPYSSGMYLAPEFHAGGVRTVAVLSRPRVPEVYLPSWRPDDFDEVIHYTGDFEEVVRRLRKLDPRCVVPGADPGVELADRLAAELTPELANVPALAAARRDKGAMAAAVAAAGLPIIPQICTDDPAEVEAWLVREHLVGHDLVVKPPRSASTDGVVRVPGGVGWRAEFEAQLGRPNQWNVRNDRMLVMAYVTGTEYVVDTFSQPDQHTVTGVTRYTKVANGQHMAVYESMEWLPPGDPAVPELVAYTRGVLDAVGMRFGAAHVELMWTDDGPRLIELNARPHGGGNPPLSQHATGDGQVDRTVRALTGSGPLPSGYQLLRHQSVVFLISRASGVVTNAEVLDQIRELPSYHSDTLRVRNGQHIDVTRDLLNTLSLGYVVLSHSDPAQVRADHDQVRSLEGELVLARPTTPGVRHAPGRHHQVRGHRLWVEQDGDGDPVLLLAGLGPAGSHVVFHPHFDALAADHRVIYVDLYGRGRSDVPDDLGDITFAGDVADVAELLAELGPAHIYGFSYGGLMGQALALDQPKLVRSLTLANSLHSPEMWQLNHTNINRELTNQYPEVWQRITALRARGVRSTDPLMQRELAVANRLVRFHNPDNADLLATESGARNVELYPLFCGEDVDFVIGGEIARIPDFRPRLAELTVPTMVLAGRYDRALYPALQQDFRRFSPAIRFEVLERSGSFGHVEEPETVHDLLRLFWKEV